METGEENCGLKRQRTPLSDSEDNVLSLSEINDGQKRRRLELAGQENRSPKPSTPGRTAELGMKPDTPMVPSIRSRVQQLTQRKEGAPLAQRCLSDPGADSPTIIQDKGFKEHLLNEGEFSQRMERFKAPVFLVGPTPSPGSACPRTRSNFVSDIHQKLQGSTTPSTKQASRIRQERDQELSKLQFQPISENAWLKRSSSDPSLALLGRTPPGPSSPSSWVPRSRRRYQWPPLQPWDVEGEAEMRDGSFTEASTSGAENPPVNATGERAPSDRQASAAAAGVELESFNDRQLETEWKEPHHPQGEELKEERDQDASGGPEEQIGPRDGGEAVKTLNFTEDQNVLELTPADKMEDSSHQDEEMEPSTDEEVRSWRYPRESNVSEELLGDSSAEEVEEEGDLESSGSDEEEVTDHILGGKCYLGEEDEKRRPEEDECNLNRDPVNGESGDERDQGAARGGDEDLKDTEGRSRENGVPQQSEDVPTTKINEADAGGDFNHTGPDSRIHQTGSSPSEDVAQTGTPVVYDESAAKDPAQAEISEVIEAGGLDETQRETQKAEGGESSKKVTFILEPEMINGSSSSSSVESRAETSVSDAELSSHDDTNTTEVIDRMFEEVLEYAGRMEEERKNDEEDAEDRDSGIGACTGDKDKMDTESEKEKSEEEEGETKEVEEEEEEEEQEEKLLEANVDEMLTFPPSGILSPLSKSVEAVVTPLRLAASQESNPPSLLLTPEDSSAPPVESAPLYSIDAYRTQRQNNLPTMQSVTPGVQSRAPEKSQPQRSVNTKERITSLNEEAVRLQNVINQTLQALSCCTDEEHGRGSLEEAEAEKLLLVSCEKRSALLAEVSRLREQRNKEGGEAELISQQPCRGTVGITNVQLPLKVEFVCSSHSRTGRPSHYFFILIRYGPCNIIATPLATAADAQNGDTISFPTSVTLKDIRSSFEIDVEVYGLSHTSGGNCSVDRATAKSRVTPRKLLNTITRSNNTLTSAALPALNPRRSSNFCLVGSHKITLASLGRSKFPLDKIRLEGKIRRLLGDEFQEKVPFLSPLEGNIYLRLESQSHSNVQHQGFLTMFELISGYGVWHRRYFVLEGCRLYYWNHPNDKETKEAAGSISLSSSPSQCVRPVKRDSCARPFTFELVSSVPRQRQQDDSQDALAKCWFSADTKQERLDWMEKLSQALLDLHTWNRASSSQQENTSSGNLRESIL